MIARSHTVALIRRALRENPVVSLVGPRQCGKTTLARAIAGKTSTFFDLENPVDLARLDSPMRALAGLKGLVVIDEIQRKPEIFPLLRVLADRRPMPARFLLLGSAAPSLMRGVSESLAGRVRIIELGGLDLAEVGSARQSRLWLRGGFPRSFLGRSERQSFEWRTDFLSTILERDLPQLGITIPAATLRRFWNMIAHFHGQIWNAAEFGRSLGTAESTARRYLDILAGAYLVRQLAPWHENLGKRQVKSPKIYVRDSGLLHGLLGLPTSGDVEGHIKYGASWEGFAIEEILSAGRSADAYFWATHAGAELDLLLFKRGRRLGFEMKCADAPSLTKSMTTAMADLKLDRLYVVHPGTQSYSLGRAIEVVPLEVARQVATSGAPRHAVR